MTTKKNKVQHFTWLSTISPERKIEILDECKVSSWKNPRKEIEAHIKKEYKNPLKIHRVMDEEKILKCPTELIWNSYLRQECQGSCIYCGFKFVNYLGKEKNKPENFKHCLGFGQSNIIRQGKRELVIVYEDNEIYCPDDAEVTSLETAELEIKELIKEFNEEEVRRYGKNQPQRELVKLLIPGEDHEK